MGRYDKTIDERLTARIEGTAQAKRGVQLGGIRGEVGRMAISRDGDAASASVRTATAAQRNERLAPVIASIQWEGKTTPQQIANALNEKGISAPWGRVWSHVQVRRTLTAGATRRATAPVLDTQQPAILGGGLMACPILHNLQISEHCDFCKADREVPDGPQTYT
jgi:hypothetical protein